MEDAPSFVDDTAEKTGMSRSSVKQAVHRAENIAPEVMDAVISDMPGVADSGVELDALAMVPKSEQPAILEAVKAGEAEIAATNIPPARRGKMQNLRLASPFHHLLKIPPKRPADFVADTAEKTLLAGGVRNFLRPLPCP